MKMEKIIVRHIDLPYGENGFVREDVDGNYNIYINARLSIDMQRKTIRHELNHVKRGDFDSVENIQVIENL